MMGRACRMQQGGEKCVETAGRKVSTEDASFGDLVVDGKTILKQNLEEYVMKV
jgi:hypothetical protein